MLSDSLHHATITFVGGKDVDHWMVLFVYKQAPLLGERCRAEVRGSRLPPPQCRAQLRDSVRYIVSLIGHGLSVLMFSRVASLPSLLRPVQGNPRSQDRDCQRLQD